jgi:diaminopimelate decarboxylase
MNLPPAVLEQIRVLARESSDPIAAFVYDLDALRTHVQVLKSCLPKGVELYYAIKANSEPEILQTLAPWVDGFEISSGGEIDRLVARKRFVFSGPGKLDSDLHRALTRQVEVVHLESLNEIARVNAIAARLNCRQPVCIRINPVLPDNFATKLSMAGAPTPFGIDEQQLAHAVMQVEQSSHLILSGFHVHAMSHQVRAERHQRLLDWYLERWPRWKSLATRPGTVRHLNVGGGMGVDYVGSEQFEWSALCGYLEKRLEQMTHPPIVRFEPGRFITAFCGYYLMQVLDIKHNHGKGFAVCRGGTHQFRLPVAQAHDHPIIHVPMRRSTGRRGQKLTLTVVGQLCTPKDVLARDVELSDPEIGDLLVLPLAGAYGYNISHADFLCHPRPKQIFIESRSAAHAGNACL